MRNIKLTPRAAASPTNAKLFCQSFDVIAWVKLRYQGSAIARAHAGAISRQSIRSEPLVNRLEHARGNARTPAKNPIKSIWNRFGTSSNVNAYSMARGVA